MHLIGVIHQDLNAENLILTKKGKDEVVIKFIDFGNSLSLQNYAIIEPRSIPGESNVHKRSKTNSASSNNSIKSYRLTDLDDEGDREQIKIIYKLLNKDYNDFCELLKKEYLK